MRICVKTNWACALWEAARVIDVELADKWLQRLLHCSDEHLKVAGKISNVFSVQ